MRKLLIGLGAIGLSAQALSAPPTAAQKKLVEDAVKLQLKDADSARFRHTDWRVATTKGIYCGYVNSKNSFGGYTGFQTFEVLVFEGRKAVMIGVDGDGIVDKVCHDNGAL
jgi:hypothetical protein